MTIKNGTTSQNASKYDYYIDYTYTFDPSKMLWTVTAKAYLKVIVYKYSGKTSYNLKIGGVSVASLSSTTLTRGDSKTTKVYTMGSGSKTYAASDKAQSVTIAGSLSAPSGGYGPGSCSASATISLPARLSTAGTLAVRNVSEENCTVVIENLAKDLGYTRTCVLYYKRDTDEEWAELTRVDVTSAETGTEFLVTDLIPGVPYSFKCEVLAPNDTVLTTLNGNVTTSSDPLTVDFSEVSYYHATITVSDLVSVSDSVRTIKGYYRLKDSDTWVLGSVEEYAAGVDIGIPSLKFEGLLDGQEYEFKLEVLYGTEVSSTAILSAKTPVNEDYTINTSIEDDKLKLHIKDNKKNYFRGNVSVYIRGGEMPYERLSISPVDFFDTPGIGWSFPYDSKYSNNPNIKVIYHRDTDNIVEEIFQLKVNDN